MPDVLILMATRNGERFLADQLDSIAAQSHAAWRLLVSDDASTDDTPRILADFARAHPPGKVVLLPGPARGAVENFRSLLRRADPAGSHVAFSDQDDVWDRDHLSRALDSLSRAPGPLAVYGCRLRICDKDLNPVGLSPRVRAPLGFRNALVQNVLSGNAMVMTPAAARLLQEAEGRAGPVPVHDWWAYQMITGAGGAAVFDPAPGVLYRQHGSNAIGLDQRLRALPARIRGHLGGRYKAWARQNAAALAACADLLTPENRRCLDAFGRALQADFPEKITWLRRSGIYYQSRRDHLALWLLIVLGRF